jgi:hypothetical protein
MDVPASDVELPGNLSTLGSRHRRVSSLKRVIWRRQICQGRRRVEGFVKRRQSGPGPGQGSWPEGLATLTEAYFWNNTECDGTFFTKIVASLSE